MSNGQGAGDEEATPLSLAGLPPSIVVSPHTTSSSSSSHVAATATSPISVATISAGNELDVDNLVVAFNSEASSRD